MKRNWSKKELTDQWEISSEELPMVQSKRGKTRLGFALLLKTFQIQGHFPATIQEIPSAAIGFLAAQLDADPTDALDYSWKGRTIERHRAEIRDWCGFREITLADQEQLKGWLIKELIPREPQPDRLKDGLLERCQGLCIEPPSPEQTQRLLQSAMQEHETIFCERIVSVQPPT